MSLPQRTLRSLRKNSKRSVDSMAKPTKLDTPKLSSTNILRRDNTPNVMHLERFLGSAKVFHEGA